MRRFILAGLVGALAIAALFVLAGEPRGSPHAGGSGGPELSDAERSLLGDRQWLNTPPLRAEDLRGKVVLVNFWTYSCINSLRALPYLKYWATKYHSSGLVVIGAHTPEFSFEKQPANVQEALRDLNVTYSVPLDANYQIWQAFDNQYWPAFYVI